MHKKQIVAMLLAFSVIFTSGNISKVYAETEIEDIENLGEESETKPVAESESVAEIDLVEESETAEDTKVSVESFEVTYVVSDDSNTLDENSSVIVVGYTGPKPDSAVVKLRNTSSSECVEVQSSQITDTDILFDCNESIEGYEIEEIIVYHGDSAQTIVMSELGIDYDEPDAYLLEEEIQVDTFSNVKKSSNGDYVVVLDPGHDDSHAGTSGNGIIEKDVNLKIATYCKQELETYYGVQVYMTRTTSACPYPGTTSVVDNTKRVEFAQSVGADAYVSFHCNYLSDSSVNGAIVFYPNSNYNSEVSNQGKDMAGKILTNLGYLGLNTRRIDYTYHDEYKYDDGSKADGYIVIREAKKRGIPAVIIEHAFVSNPSDAAFLGNESNLINMGIADATGIAQHFGLVKSGFGIRNVNLKQENECTTISVDSYSSVGNLKYKAQVYDTTTGQWFTIAEQQTSPTIQWKPEAKTYGIHVEAQAPDGNIREYNLMYTSDINYNEPYVKINGIIPMETSEGINVGADYISNDKSVEFQWLSYNTETKQWGTIADWNGGNWATWKPNHGSYWICVKAKTSDGREVTQTIGYVVNEDYGSDYIRITGPTWIINKYSIDLGVAYKNRGSQALFKWQIYNLDTGKWQLLADWNSGNWVTWRPTPGNYWVNIQAKTQNGSTDEYTYCFNVSSDKSKTPIKIDGLSWIINRNSIDIGTGYSTEDKNVQFKWQAYNLDTKKWSVIADWNGGNWATWKPQAGNYWLHVEAKNSDGGYDEKTICFAVDKDYSKYYVDLNGICLIDNKITYDVGASYSSDDPDVKFRWLQYDLSNNTWSVISDWSGSNWANWDTANGNYWLCVEAKTSDGVMSTTSMGYTVSARYEIMGQSSTNVYQMVNYYNKNATYPAFYSNTDAPTIESFCQIYIEECASEGVKAEVAFCQAMKETGFLRFGGDVNIAQFNFAGLGATGGGVQGASFGSVREGIRAQVQHLKAYGCSERLNNVCVDPRFSYVSRGCSKYVEWLGIGENPYGKGWAVSENYGYSIVRDYISKLRCS